MPNPISLGDPNFFEKVNATAPYLFDQEKMGALIKKEKTSNNPNVEEILNKHGAEDGEFTYSLVKTLAQREEALLTYLADMYSLPVKEVLKTAAMWREKGGL